MPELFLIVFLVGPAMWLWIHLKWWIEERRKSKKATRDR